MPTADDVGKVGVGKCGALFAEVSLEVSGNPSPFIFGEVVGDGVEPSVNVVEGCYRSGGDVVAKCRDFALRGEQAGEVNPIPFTGSGCWL